MRIASRKLGISDEELKNTLIGLYVDEEMSMKQVCGRLGISLASMRDLFKHFDIKTRKITKISQRMIYGRVKFYEAHGFASERELVKQLKDWYYKQKLSQPKIAKKLDCCVQQISKIFRQHGLKTRSFADGNKLNIRPDVKISKEQKKIIDGMLLGDGHIEERKYSASLQYCCKHRSVLEDLRTRLSPMEFCPIYKRVKPDHTGYSLRTHSYAFLTKQHKRWYPKDVKIVPQDINLNSLTCYWWYLGDGTSGNNYLRLCTNSFTDDEVDLLIGKMPVKAFRRYTNSQPVIIIRTAEIEPFLRYIGSCKHPVYRHRWIVRRGKRGKKRTDLSGL